MGQGGYSFDACSVTWPLTAHPFRDRGIGGARGGGEGGGEGGSTGGGREAVVTVRNFGSGGTMSKFTSFGGIAAFFCHHRATPRPR